MHSQIDEVKVTRPPIGGEAVLQNPGEVTSAMIVAMCPGEPRPVYDVALTASALQEDPQLEHALQTSLKEDHFSSAARA